MFIYPPRNGLYSMHHPLNKQDCKSNSLKVKHHAHSSLPNFATTFNLQAPVIKKNDLNDFHSPVGLKYLTLFGENVSELDVLEFDYFPALRYLTLKNTSTVTIPESFIKFTTLTDLDIFDCKHFEEIQGLPQSLNYLEARNCSSWNPQSSNKILSQVIAKKIAKWKQVRKSQGVLADRVHEGERNPLPSTEFSHPLHHSIDEVFNWGYGSFLAPGSEISKEFNHQSDGNSISFMVGQNWRFPYPFAVCVALGPTNRYCDCLVEADDNGFQIHNDSVFLEKNESCRLWFSSGLLCKQENELNLSRQSHFKGFHGDLNMSLLIPIDLKVHPSIWIIRLSKLARGTKLGVSSTAKTNASAKKQIKNGQEEEK
nr:hypothetical protein CFP56_71822 [Quercus suber]